MRPNSPVPRTSSVDTEAPVDVPHPGCNRFLGWVVTLSAISSVISGYDQGVIAGAMLTLKDDLSLTGVQLELVVGSLNIAAALGGIVTGMIADAKGRRWTITLANLLFLTGSLFLTMARGFTALLIGRILMGLGVGIALVAAPIFTAEISPAHMRGSLVAMSDVSINAGILLGYSVGIDFYGIEGGWRYMFAIGMLPAGLLSLLIWTVPESARWLLMQDRYDEARDALRLIGDEEYAEKEMLAIRKAMRRDYKAGRASWWEIFSPTDEATRRMLVAGLGLAFFSQACGTEAVTYYIPRVMANAGLNKYQSLQATMAAGASKVLFLLISSQLFDRVGRRPMLLLSAIGLAASFGSVSLSYVTDSWTLTIAGICGIMGSFSLGFSPLVYVVGTEVFPNRLRAKAMSLALFITRILAGVVAISFITLEHLLGQTLLWFSFCCIALSAMIFIFFNVPETNGLELEDVADAFRKGDISGVKESVNKLQAAVAPSFSRKVDPTLDDGDSKVIPLLVTK